MIRFKRLFTFDNYFYLSPIIIFSYLLLKNKKKHADDKNVTLDQSLSQQHIQLISLVSLRYVWGTELYDTKSYMHTTKSIYQCTLYNTFYAWL